ncbi:MAG: HAD hydrolase family protein [Lachnospiraceae bacterium]
MANLQIQKKTKDSTYKEPWKLPPVGMRIIKSMIGVLLCFAVSYFRPNGIVFYSQLAVLWCIMPYVSNSLEMGIQRTIGTMIGAAFGLLLLIVEQAAEVGDFRTNPLWAAVISLCIIPVIYVTVLINRKNASYFSCVVFLSIVVNHAADSNPYLFVLNRVLDTMIGIVLGVAINSFRLPRKKHKEILFISDLDDTLVTVNESLTPYSKVELNRLLDDGAKLVISTMRTPGSMIEVLSDIRLNMPVIAMDGAVLYDIAEKRFEHVYVISYETARQVNDFIGQQRLHVFINMIVEDMVVIYYGDFRNETEADIFEKMRKSPYRNYVKKELPVGDTPVYFMLVDKTEVIERFYERLLQQEFAGRLKVLCYPSEDYPGYSYIKIYNRNASKENMAHYLQETYEFERVITFGSEQGKCDVLIDRADNNRMVKEMHRLYEPVIWSKK